MDSNFMYESEGYETELWQYDCSWSDCFYDDLEERLCLEMQYDLQPFGDW